ncbi:MAG TPA: CHAT domain-containing tetratricopeptide repeat protein [Stellaceae bacterium]|nr:CHAT domain-containing tetratricopeptide repeat protein [Stellaceae bacterium]
MTRSALILAAAALALLPGAARAADKGAGLGTDLAGEACAFGSPAGAAGDASGVAIACGNAASAGALYVLPHLPRLPDAAAARRAAIVAAAKTMPGGLGRGDDIACDGGSPLTQGSAWLFFACTERSGAWPRVVLVVPAGGALYQADGMPALLPVLEAAVAARSGQALSPAETEAALHLLEQHFPAALAHAGSADAASEHSLVELARLDGAQRNFAAAEAANRRALEIETRLFGAESAAVGETLMELALEVSNQGRFDEADGLFRRAQPIVEASGSVSARARLQSYLALNAANQRHYGDALKFARAATALRRAELDQQAGGANGEAQAPASRGELAHSLRIEATMALKLGDLPDALAAAEEVLAIIGDEPGLPLWWRPDAVAMMAEINSENGRVVEAERQFREALALDEKLFGDTAPTIYAELRLGRFYSEQQLYPAAVTVFRRALDGLARDEVARAAILPDQIVPFLAAASDVAAKNPNARADLDAQMFRAIQLVSSDVTGRTIARAAAAVASANPALADATRAAAEAQRRRDAARIELAAETAKPNAERDATREKKLAAEMAAAGADADKLARKIAADFPDYTKLADPGPAALAAVERSLGAREAFLSFVIGVKGSYALLVTHDALTVAPVKEDEAALAADVGELRQAFVPRLGGLPAFDLEASYELYGRLLGPLAGALAGVDRLVVASSGALASLPLDLLVTERPRQGAGYGEAAWLVRRMAVTDVPSPRAFLALRALGERRAPAPKPFLAVADPAFAGAGTAGGNALDALAARCRDNGPIAPELLRALPPLHETATEAKTVAHLLGAGDNDVLTGTNATEANLRAEPLADFGVLYFATHGILPGELHCQSEPALALSPPASAATSPAADGLLDASEIAQLKLNADLVVLSACNTAASGGTFGGEALAGLADAFFTAGARAVIASHWPVPSLATVKLMTGLFATYAADRHAGLAEALRQAQLTMLRDPATAHPFNWAAFTIIGAGAGEARPAPAEAEPAGRRT